MGNENSKKKGPMKDGKNGEKHLNGKVNSLKVKNKSDQNGATIEKAEKPNGELTTNTKNKESIVETDGFNVEAPVNGSKDIPGISTEAQVISPKKVPTIQKQQTDEAKGVLKDDEEAPSSQQPEQADTAKNQDSETLEEPKSVTLDLKLAAGQTDNDDQKSQPEEKKEESDQNPVMNFFKTLVTPTKSQKKETATPDVTKDQPPKETPPTVASTTVAQVPEPPAAAKGMSIPPPPPPEPPKMEIKGGLAAQQQKPTPKEGAKASAKQPDAAKGKSAKETLSSFFRSKASKPKSAPSSGANAPAKTDAVEIQEVLQQVDQVQETAECLPQPVVEVQTVEEVVPEPVVVEVEKADASKTTTLEADVKPQAAAPLPDDKKPAAKSPFFSFFKPKVLVNQMAAKVQSASTSGVRLLRRTAGGAAEPKKETAAPPAAMEAAQNTKAKEEPKAATKTAEASVENKAPSEAAQGGDESAKAPKKLEKRNSINLFFKTLSQKRNSLDAGVQTESAAAAPASEKTK
ncbi:breast carcinoma-amplified sequence 1 isoform X2 [Gadus morhua]|uniref:breast carcinoma-amplified sequence 1 isoform X2 n=1 Tax=Gadus morhua TaxID=8049 RepID=UPI0011B57BF8|nr:breast carcinoma-amplified sequence 1 homolog isoform X2 [Gadus morhua]